MNTIKGMRWDSDALEWILDVYGEQLGSGEYLLGIKESHNGSVAYVVYDVSIVLWNNYDNQSIEEFYNIVQENALDIEEFEVDNAIFLHD